MSHVYDFATLCVAVWLLLRCARRPTLLSGFLLGITLALHASIRIQNVVAAVLFGVALLALGHPMALRWRLVAGYLGGVLLAILPQLVANLSLFGTLLAVPVRSRYWSRFPAHVVDVLFSWRNGWISFHPIIVLGLAGLAPVFSRLRRRGERAHLVVFSVLVLGALAQLVLNAGVRRWWAGMSFGHRRMIVALPLIAVGFAWTFAKLVRWRPALSRLVLLAALGYNAYLTAIRVEFWGYSEEPKPVWEWMLIRAPEEWLGR